MSEELEKLLDDGQKKDQAPSGDKTPEQIKEEKRIKDEAHLANIQKAIQEGNEDLKKIRDAKKKAKTEPDEEDESPKIDFNDPSAKAWNKHISSEVKPLQEEMAKEKEEIRTFAIQQFMKSNPVLSKDPEKLKKVLGTYEKIRTASERTVEGVIIDLRKAFAAEYADEILQDNENSRMERAAGEVVFSDVAISRGTSSFREEKEAAPRLSKDDELILARWGMSSDEWVKLKKSQKK